MSRSLKQLIKNDADYPLAYPLAARSVNVVENLRRLAFVYYLEDLTAPSCYSGTPSIKALADNIKYPFYCLVEARKRNLLGDQ